MATRTNTKIGDVFEVKLDDNSKKHFQYIANDLTQLNSDVIRAFKKRYFLNENPSFNEIVTDEVDFYAHCITKLGIKLNLWKKIGNISDIGELKEIIFRSSRDVGVKVGEEPVKISYNWYIWKINEPFNKVGRLEGANQKAEIGTVVNPYDIIDRMKAGKYNFVYPGF